MSSILICALGIFLFRYNRLFVHAIVWRRVKPIPVPKDLSLSVKDVTVVIPTVCGDHQLKAFERTLESISRQQPHAIIVITPAVRAEIIRRVATTVNTRIEVVASPRTSKRAQLWLGLQKVKTKITVCADDDVEWRWNGTGMSSLLAPFADPRTGAVGTCQRVERTSWNPIEYLGAIYVLRRNQETKATSSIDGALSCLSGRTFAIRTFIAKQPWFGEDYLGEKWRGRPLNPDDDNFITRFLFDGGWKVRIQSAEDAVVYTTLEPTLRKYLSQCIRWERSRWRHTFTLVTKHPRIWTKQRWSTWALYFQVLFHSLWTDPAMAFFWYKSEELSLAALIVFMLGAKLYRNFEHYKRNPTDLLLFPITVLFVYCHGLIKLYALCTLSNVSWGSRDVSEEGNAPIKANTSADAVLSHSLRDHRPVVINTLGNKLHFGDGNFLFDATGGAGVTCLGSKVHQVRSAMHRAPVAHVLDRSFSTKPAEQLAKALLETTNGKFSRAYFCCSGSDGMETAIKLARQYHHEKGEKDRDMFIARKQSYHGSTLGTLGLGGHLERRAIYESLLTQQVRHVSACNPYRDREGLSDAQYVMKKAHELEEEFRKLGPNKVIAFVVEPVAGAALGCVPAVPGYLAAMGAVCKRHGALIIFDEIMCGIGRTGQLHAWERDGFAPDIQVLGKGLGAGEQAISAVLCNEDVENSVRGGSGQFAHGFTFQNNAVACAAALEVLRIIREDMLLENVKRVGSIMNLGLHKELDAHPFVGDIRGVGLFIAIEFVQNKHTKAPFNPHLKIHKRVFDTAIKKYRIVVYNASGTADGQTGDHILIAPPYTCTEADAQFMVEGITEAIKCTFADMGTGLMDE